MRKTILGLLLALLCTQLYAQGSEYIKMVTFISDDGGRVLLTSVGKADKRADVYANAVKSAFYTLFYIGVDGVNGGEPLIMNENVAYTNTFFDDNYMCQYYIVENAQQDVRLGRENGMFKGTYQVEVKYQSLISALVRNRVHADAASVPKAPVVQPTVMAVPLANHDRGESFKSVLGNNTDIRVAINAVKDAFVKSGLEIVDFETILSRSVRIEQYNENAGDAWSNDKQLLQSSNADVYVTVFTEKKQSASGLIFTLIIEANDIMTGRNYGSKEISLPPIQTEAINRVCSQAADKIVPELVEDIKRGLITTEIRIPIEFSIHGESMMTMNSRVGPKNYPISNIIHQWIGQNAYNRQFRRRGIADTNMRYDYVVIPPVDADGMPMDAGQFAFLLEMYLKEEIGVNCISRIDGNLLLFTLDPPEDF